MKRQKNNNPQPKDELSNRQEHPLRGELGDIQKKQAAEALREAERDMEKDPEVSSQNPNDDLDEGESARLGEETDLI